MENLNAIAPVFPAEKQDELKRLVSGLNHTQITWLHGYVEGLLTGGEQAVESHLRKVPVKTLEGNTANLQDSLTILFGSHTGNSKKIARQLFDAGKSKGLNVKLADLNEYRPQSLRNEKKILLIVSTHGEGEPPVAAEDFYEFLHSKRAPRLEHLEYSVLALGDRSYLNFCKTGIDIDKRLEELGGKPIVPRTDCDIDFEALASEWIKANLEKLGDSLPAANTNPTLFTEAPNIEGLNNQASRSNPGKVEVAEVINLNGKGSSKKTYHLELLADESQFTYQPGDALAISPKNDPELVKQVLKKLKYKTDQPVGWQNETISMESLLSSQAEISSISRDTLERYNQFAKSDELEDILSHTEKLKPFLWGFDLLDLLNQYPAKLSPAELAGVLRKLQPRSYSIASSSQMYPGEIHLTVGLVEYELRKRKRTGSGSSFLGERVDSGSILSGFIEENENFRLPKDGNTDIIMIGPGTGVAPFRAFMQEREITGASGRNWLFFGDRNFTTDFLYQTEWQKWQKSGLLNQIDMAFSRDQEEKVYVQHKILSRSRKLYSWLEEGAKLYVCGDASRMASDVEAALVAVVQKESGKTEEEARGYIKSLKKSKRYLEDVY